MGDSSECDGWRGLFKKIEKIMNGPDRYCSRLS